MPYLEMLNAPSNNNFVDPEPEADDFQNVGLVISFLLSKDKIFVKIGS